MRANRTAAGARPQGRSRKTSGATASARNRTVGTPLPREIIEIEPQRRGYEYLMVGDQVVIVDPRSMEAVAILDV
jgi:hypothetical protein